MNFPIFNNDFNFTKETMFDYLLSFPEHKIVIKTQHDVFLKKKTLQTFHTFSDKLKIIMSWDMNENLSIVRFTFDMVSIKKLVDDSLLILKSFSFESFSSNEYIHEFDNNNVFFHSFSLKSPLLPKELYHFLEFEVNKSTSINDNEFSKLINDIYSFLLFEEFLKKRNNK